MHCKATQTLLELMLRVGKNIKKYKSEDIINPNDLLVIGMLFHDDIEDGSFGVRMSDISRCLMVSKPAATQVINQLVDMGMVERYSDPNDRRVVMIRPTEKGRASFAERLDERMDVVDRAVRRIGEENAEKLTELLGVFVEAVCSEEKGGN
ncbi:MAG: MarR family transcriptional regulator [Clostridia bacterium]|nr:MarR family transcriptional regulator [Clostridia bacterium]